MSLLQRLFQKKNTKQPQAAQAEELVSLDILRGSKSKKIQTAKLNKINGYGKLSAIKREDVEFLVDWLIENGFILKTKGPYPVLHPTYNGNHYSEIITRQKLQALKRKLGSTE